jgi:predicted  nucleic acid-binding Zn-ribbon protein
MSAAQLQRITDQAEQAAHLQQLDLRSQLAASVAEVEALNAQLASMAAELDTAKEQVRQYSSTDCLCASGSCCC